MKPPPPLHIPPPFAQAEATARSLDVATLLDGLVKAARTEGVLVLWRGLLPRLLLKSCGSSIWYSVYMTVLRLRG